MGSTPTSRPLLTTGRCGPELEHLVGRLGQVAVGPQDLGGRGHVVQHRGHARGGPVGQRRRQVPLGDDPDQVLALEDVQAGRPPALLPRAGGPAGSRPFGP
jgi:hypothetical protein